MTTRSERLTRRQHSHTLYRTRPERSPKLVEVMQSFDTWTEVHDENGNLVGHADAGDHLVKDDDGLKIVNSETLSELGGEPVVPPEPAPEEAPAEGEG